MSKKIDWNAFSIEAYLWILNERARNAKKT